MRVGPDARHHLTYCGNVHASNGWKDVFANLRETTLELKRRLAPDRAFGVGLRLSAAEAEDLLIDDRLQGLRDLLERQGLYLFTIIGFPYGAFHHQRVKEQVFAPDWTTEARRAYTLRLVAILAALLPEGVEGSISTVPISYKAWSQRWNREGYDCAVMQLVAVVENLAILQQMTGKRIHLDLEPEPGGTLSNTGDVVRFFEGWLLPRGGHALAKRLGIAVPEAEAKLLEHVRICLDACHLAVAYEEPEAAIARLEGVGIQIGKIQLSSALKVSLPTDLAERRRTGEDLGPLAEPIYLHQVMARMKGGFQRYFPDLPQALLDLTNDRAQEWRIHFHVPLFAESYERFLSTQAETRRLLELWLKRPFSQHLEIETYTWEVLPAALKQGLVSALEQEYRWVLGVLAGDPLAQEARMR